MSTDYFLRPRKRFAGCVEQDLSILVANHDGRPPPPRLRRAPPKVRAKAEQTIEEFAREHNKPNIEKRVFEIRFGFRIDSDWFKNADKNDVRTIWTLLRCSARHRCGREHMD